MLVDADGPLHLSHRGTVCHICSPRCLNRFKADSERYAVQGAGRDADPPVEASATGCDEHAAQAPKAPGPGAAACTSKGRTEIGWIYGRLTPVLGSTRICGASLAGGLLLFRSVAAESRDEMENAPWLADPQAYA